MQESQVTKIKTCSKCRLTKELHLFSRHCRKSDGYDSTCKDCVKIASREWRKNNPEKQRVSHKASWLKRAYGITLEEYNAIHSKQSGVCAICKQAETRVGHWGLKLDLAVDHCHSTGRIRGLLCANCNQAIGLLRHLPENCKTAEQYLINSSASDEKS